MLKRKVYDRLLTWKRKSNGKSAILVDGWRRKLLSEGGEESCRQQ